MLLTRFCGQIVQFVLVVCVDCRKDISLCEVVTIYRISRWNLLCRLTVYSCICSVTVHTAFHAQAAKILDNENSLVNFLLEHSEVSSGAYQTMTVPSSGTPIDSQYEMEQPGTHRSE